MRRLAEPGPQVMTSNPALFWGLIVSMWIGNLMLVILNLPLIGMWIKLLTVPYRMLYPAILLFCCIGVYSLNNNVWDVYMTVACLNGVGNIWSSWPIPWASGCAKTTTEKRPAWPSRSVVMPMPGNSVG